MQDDHHFPKANPQSDSYGPVYHEVTTQRKHQCEVCGKVIKRDSICHRYYIGNVAHYEHLPYRCRKDTMNSYINNEFKTNTNQNVR